MSRLSAAVLHILMLLACAATQAAATRDLSGQWRFAIDRDDQGVANAGTPARCRTASASPASCKAQGYGDEITARTPWVLSLYDKNWHQREDYKPYTNHREREGAFPEPATSATTWAPLGTSARSRCRSVARQARHAVPGASALGLAPSGSTGAPSAPICSLVAEHVVDARPAGAGQAPCLGARRQPHADGLPAGLAQRLRFAGHELERHRRQDGTARHLAVYGIDDAQVYPDVADRSARASCASRQ
jgi:hypothetical protein